MLYSDLFIISIINYFDTRVFTYLPFHYVILITHCMPNETKYKNRFQLGGQNTKTAVSMMQLQHQQWIAVKLAPLWLCSSFSSFSKCQDLIKDLLYLIEQMYLMSLLVVCIIKADVCGSLALLQMQPLGHFTTLESEYRRSMSLCLG